MPDSTDLPPILQAFGRDLANAMETHSRRSPRRGVDPAGWLRRLRMGMLVFGCLLAVATLALAADGVILTGTSVRPEELLNPNVGEGMPAAGASQLLALRVPDPEGGLAWGMRVVHTTRGEVCVQIGRVQNGQLGELGIDGAFHDDGRFHPIEPDALPADSFHGHLFDPSWGIANANTDCHLAGEAVAGEHIGLDRGAGANPSGSPRPLRELRDVSYGLLGPQAVKVRYRSGATHASEDVVAGVGAYLIVQRTAPGEQIESGHGSLGSQGDLAPIAPLSTITYRLGGKLCERGPSLPPGGVSKLSDPCPSPHFPSHSSRALELHRALHVQLLLSGRVITGVHVSFLAPYTVNSARQEYLIEIPDYACAGAGGPGRRRTAEASGYAETAIARNVRQGEAVSRELSAREVFTRACARTGANGRPQIARHALRAAVLEVRYRRVGSAPVTVARATVRAPAGTVPGPLHSGPYRQR